MTDFRRDAALAAGCGVVLLGMLVVFDWTRALLDPVGITGGVTVALALEAAFFADTPAATLWDRPAVRVASVSVLLLGGAGGALLVGPVVVAAACWGLATYVAFLALAATGAWP